MNGLRGRRTLGVVLVGGIGLLLLNGAAAFERGTGKGWIIASTPRQANQVLAAQKDLVALAKDIENGKSIAAKAEAIQKKYALEDVMHLYKPAKKNGLGFSALGEGIEETLNSISTRGIQDGELAILQKELIRVAYLNSAVAEVARLNAPKPRNGKGPREWKEYTDSLKSASMDFLKAVKSGDPRAVKTAANNINNACNTCHTDFRD